MRNDWVRCGVSCDRCHQDEWFPIQGMNRCACGQELWVERVNENGATRFRYAQAATVRPGYAGWSNATK